MKRVRPPTNPERNTYKQVPRGAVYLQAFCRARHGDLVYLGRDYSKFKVAATPKGMEALVADGFKAKPTPGAQGDKSILVVTPN